jgi:hypothetical protein
MLMSELKLTLMSSKLVLQPLQRQSLDYIALPPTSRSILASYSRATAGQPRRVEPGWQILLTAGHPP